MTFDPSIRKHGVGASEAAAVLGLSRYKSPLDVYLDKVKTDVTPRPDTVATKRGKRLEPVVLDMYEEACGPIYRTPPQVTSQQYPFMFATLDAVRVDDGRPVEAKTAGKFVAPQWGDAETDDVPQEYLIQVTHQAIVLGKDVGDLPALLTLDDFRNYTISKDPELAGLIIEGLTLFWKRVENREPPEPTTGEEVERLYRKTMALPVAADDKTANAYRELCAIREAIKPLEVREKKLTDDIKLFMRDRETLIVEETPVLTWKSAKGGVRFDVKRLQSERPEIYAEYLTQGQPSRRFLIRGESHAS